MIRFILLCLLAPVFLIAQSTVEMADSFRADGKIYVVVAVVAVILFGIFFYLFRTERKLDKIEKTLGK
jgi:CcmD family protein